MAFSFAIDTSGEAFDAHPRAEIARLMREHADRIEWGVCEYEGTCKDINGRSSANGGWSG